MGTTGRCFLVARPGWLRLTTRLSKSTWKRWSSRIASGRDTVLNANMQYMKTCSASIALNRAAVSSMDRQPLPVRRQGHHVDVGNGGDFTILIGANERHLAGRHNALNVTVRVALIDPRPPNKRSLGVEVYLRNLCVGKKVRPLGERVARRVATPDMRCMPLVVTD